MTTAVSLFVKQQSKQKFWMNESKFLNVNAMMQLQNVNVANLLVCLSEKSSNSTLSEFITQHFIMPPTSKKLRGHIGFGLSVQCSE